MKTVTLNVEGMMCEHCVAHVKEALEGVRGVKEVAVSLDEGKAVVQAGMLTTEQSLVDAVEAADYHATVAA